jgi:hypothetical protein
MAETLDLGLSAETKTMLPAIQAFMAAHHLPDVTVAAGAGMVSEANQKEIEAAGLSLIPEGDPRRATGRERTDRAGQI